MEFRNEEVLRRRKGHSKGNAHLARSCSADGRGTSQEYWKPLGKRKRRRPRRYWEDELEVETAWRGLGPDDGMYQGQMEAGTKGERGKQVTNLEEPVVSELKYTGDTPGS